uniref:MORN repeat-containing protein 5 n=1 Tax=Grammatophora oceanica TaxID=210454 RepID=A0A7S1VM06_9STRA
MVMALLRDELLDPALMDEAVSTKPKKQKKKRRSKSIEAFPRGRRAGSTHDYEAALMKKRRSRYSVSPPRSPRNDLYAYASDDRSTARGSVKSVRSSKSARKTEKVARKLDEFQKLYYEATSSQRDGKNGATNHRRRRSLGSLEDVRITRSARTSSRADKTKSSNGKNGKAATNGDNNTRRRRSTTTLDAFITKKNSKAELSSSAAANKASDNATVNSNAAMSFRGYGNGSVSTPSTTTRSSRRCGSSRSLTSAPATMITKKRHGSVDPTKRSSRLEKIDSARKSITRAMEVLDGESPSLADLYGTPSSSKSRGRSRNGRSQRTVITPDFGSKADDATASDGRKSIASTSATENTSTGSLSTGCSFEDDNLFPLISPRKIVVEKNKNDAITTYILVDNKDGTMKERRGRYVGALNKNRQPHAQMGTIQFDDGDMYKGPFEHGEMHGDLGHFLYKDGDEYTGGFRRNLRHGQGVYVTVNSRQYIGKFRHDKPNGHGVLYNADGSVFFEGKWKDGVPLDRENKRKDLMASTYPQSPEAEEEDWESLGRKVIEQLVAEGI